MGALWRPLRWTFLTFLIATIAIAGVFPLAGFFSKDEILWSAFNPSNKHGHFLLWLVGWCAAGMTAFYMFRLVALTFWGKSRIEPAVMHHVHESAPSMVVPLVILAVLSIVGGWVNIPGVLGGREHLHHFMRFLDTEHGRYSAGVATMLADVEHAGVEAASHSEETAATGAAAPAGASGHGEPAAATNTGEHGAEAAHEAQELSLMWLSLGIAFAGIFLALGLYLYYPHAPGMIQMRTERLYDLLYNKYYVDEFYDATIVNGTKKLGDTLADFDRNVVDGVVNGVARATVWTADQSGKGDLSVVDGLVNWLADAIGRFGEWLRHMQSGYAQSYIVWMAFGVFVMAIAYIVL